MGQRQMSWLVQSKSLPALMKQKSINQTGERIGARNGKLTRCALRCCYRNYPDMEHRKQ